MSKKPQQNTKKNLQKQTNKKVQREHLGSPQTIQHLGGKIIHVIKNDDSLLIF